MPRSGICGTILALFYALPWLSAALITNRNIDIKIANRSFENMAQFTYLVTTITNQNLIQKEIKRRLNSSNTCYHSIHNFLYSRLLSKNINIKIYKTTILSVVLYWCETWSLILREEHRFRVFQNKVLRRICWLKRDEVTGRW
jgi:hypothetical protein